MNLSYLDILFWGMVSLLWIYTVARLVTYGILKSARQSFEEWVADVGKMADKIQQKKEVTNEENQE